MNENVENLILVQLREIRTDLTAMKADVAALKSGQDDINQKVNGLTVLLTMLAGHVYHIEQRVEKLEGNRP